MYIYIYIYIHKYTYIYIYIYICKRSFIYLSVHEFAPTVTCSYIEPTKHVHILEPPASKEGKGRDAENVPCNARTATCPMCSAMQ